MRVLVMGSDGNYGKEFVEYCLLPHKDEIYRLIFGKNLVFANFYRKNRVHVVTPAKEAFGVRKYYRYLKAAWRLRKEKFDLIFICYVDPVGLLLNFLIKTEKTKSIACFWGDDVNSVPRKTVLIEKLLFPRVDVFNFYTKTLRKTFFDKFGRSYRQQKTQIRYGLSLLPVMDSVLASGENVRDSLGLPREKVLVAVGYNNVPEQQHLRVLEQISKLPIYVQERLHIILGMTYGYGDVSYVQEVRQACNRLVCTYTMYQERLDEREKARLTLAIDIFIHAQVMDCFSGTILEHLYAGALLINPAWIFYDALKEKNVFYLEYGAFDELPTLLAKHFYRKEEMLCEASLRENRMKIREMASWENIVPLWDTLCGRGNDVE